MEIYETEEFKKLAQKALSRAQRMQLRKKQARLKVTDGKPLGPSYLRELKLQEKRVYYVIQGTKALFVSISNKKSQQHVINTMHAELDALKQSIT